jgi:hypothetical protein
MRRRWDFADVNCGRCGSCGNDKAEMIKETSRSSGRKSKKRFRWVDGIRNLERNSKWTVTGKSPATANDLNSRDYTWDDGSTWYGCSRRGVVGVKVKERMRYIGSE